MIDAFFWYTGVVFWILIAAAAISFLPVEVNDRSVRHRLMQKITFCEMREQGVRGPIAPQ